MTTKKKPVAMDRIDPTLPYTEIEICGKTYKLCFVFRAIAKGDAMLRRQGIDSRLLWRMPEISLESLPIVLAAALAHYHPELSFDDVVAMLDWDTVFDLRDQVLTAWASAFPKRTKEDTANPPQPDPS